VVSSWDEKRDREKCVEEQSDVHVVCMVLWVFIGERDEAILIQILQMGVE